MLFLSSLRQPLSVGNMSQYKYDITPYFSYPFYKTHPENLFTIARLFGLDPVDYRSARTLELGCAAGGNIIPLAYNYPESEVTGVDLSIKQIEQGRKQIFDLELKNISLKHMSIMEVDKNFGKFDYIICHGVYSWVPDDVREKIISICSNNLSSDGIAYVSYNCLPGWNMVQSIRDMMLYHVDRLEEPQEKAEQARIMLQFIIDSCRIDETPYSNFLRSEMELLSGLEDSYLLHDHLEDVNQPVYFHEFIDRAEKKGLGYLGDTDLHTMYIENFSDEVSKKINEINDIIRAEQYMDFIRNRRFRSTLLCHGNKSVIRDIHVDHIKNFYITTNAAPEKEVEENDFREGVPLTFVGEGATLTVRNRVSKTAMYILTEKKGQPVSYDELCRETIFRTGVNQPEYIREQVNNDLNLIRLLFAGIVSISGSPGNYTLDIAEKPYAGKLARYQAMNGKMVTNQRHETVMLNSAEKILIQYLDGSSDMDHIAKKMCSHIETEELVMEKNGDKISDPVEMLKSSHIICKSILQAFAENALLIEKDFTADPDG